MRKFICALSFVLLAVTFAVGDFTATITEVSKDGKTISYLKKGKKGDKGTKGTIAVAEGTKVTKGKIIKKLVAPDLTEAAVIKGGLTNEMFSPNKIGKGVLAHFITEGEGEKEVVKDIILIMPAKKKKANK